MEMIGFLKSWGPAMGWKHAINRETGRQEIEYVSLRYEVEIMTKGRNNRFNRGLCDENYEQYQISLPIPDELKETVRHAEKLQRPYRGRIYKAQVTHPKYDGIPGLGLAISYRHYKDRQPPLVEINLPLEQLIKPFDELALTEEQIRHLRFLVDGYTQLPLLSEPTSK